MVKEIQYELWQECNSRCTYCSLGLENRCTPIDKKLESLRTTYQELRKFTKGQYDTLGFIGGEFFQGQLSNPEVLVAFTELICMVNRLLNNGIIETFWLNATMNIGDQSDLWNTLDQIDQKSKVWVLTSFDTEGRFHTPKMLQTWIDSMKKLHEDYPEVRVNTTSIITGHFIDMYLEDLIDLSQFKSMYNTSLFLKTPVKPDHLCKKSQQEINQILGYEFFPTRDKFLQFLLKYKEKEGIEEFNNLFSNELKAEEVRKNYNEDNLRNVVFKRDKTSYEETLDCDPSIKMIDTLPCGHSCIYQSYSDCDGCSICDKQLITEL